MSGMAVAIGNGVLAWGTIRLAWGRNSAVFFQVFFVGMAVRLLAIGGVVAGIFSFTSLQKGPFIFALMVTYLVLQVGEVVLIIRKRDAERSRGTGLTSSIK